MLLLAAGAYADVFGNALQQRSYVDQCDGCVFAYLPVPAGDVGQTLDDWSYYADQNSVVGNLITPILFLSLGSNNFQVAAIGATQHNAGPGVQHYLFGLQPGGNAVLQAGEYLGWVDGTPAGATNSGTISFDGTAEGAWWYNSYPGIGSIAVGNNITLMPSTVLGTVSFEDRTYSINGSTVPEPTSILLFGICLVGVGNRLRRRVR